MRYGSKGAMAGRFAGDGIGRRPVLTRGQCSRSIPLSIVGPPDIHNLGLRQLLIRNLFRNVKQIPVLREVKLEAPGTPQLILITDPAAENGLQSALSAMRAANEAARIVVLIDRGNETMIEMAMALSAHAILCHQIEVRALVAALDIVLEGDSVLSIDFMPVGTARPALHAIGADPIEDSPVAPPQLSALSNREEDILKCLTNGVSNKIIARKFDIAESTVKIHVKSILRKINVCNRTQAAVWALAHSPSPASSAVAHEDGGGPLQAEGW